MIIMPISIAPFTRMTINSVISKNPKIPSNTDAWVRSAIITGVPLPFVSFGGSALIVTMTAFGILLNIARQTP